MPGSATTARGERDGDRTTAARLYAEAAHKAPNLAERAHLTRQAARLNARLNARLEARTRSTGDE
ncbi:hypothetical protein [Streptomyces caniscabiei]|uniref:hypothetical protein n=1 Tax=Streptomyces caniscabiei TaxID=2746961 RepID=UPI000A3A5E91|nr:hypothetical protein [Streptomyces caniscabiei]